MLNFLQVERILSFDILIVVPYGFLIILPFVNKNLRASYPSIGLKIIFNFHIKPRGENIYSGITNCIKWRAFNE